MMPFSSASTIASVADSNTDRKRRSDSRRAISARRWLSLWFARSSADVLDMSDIAAKVEAHPPGNPLPLPIKARRIANGGSSRSLRSPPEPGSGQGLLCILRPQPRGPDHGGNRLLVPPKLIQDNGVIVPGVRAAGTQPKDRPKPVRRLLRVAIRGAQHSKAVEHVGVRGIHPC